MCYNELDKKQKTHLTGGSPYEEYSRRTVY
jgi:hypothetical protein